jgi:hypothetical protein
LEHVVCPSEKLRQGHDVNPLARLRTDHIPAGFGGILQPDNSARLPPFAVNHNNDVPLGHLLDCVEIKIGELLVDRA